MNRVQSGMIGMVKKESDQPFRLGVMLPPEASKKLLFLSKRLEQEPYSLVCGAIEIMWKVEVNDDVE
jgi:hypothetical protein